ncbi:hypothetical protein AMTRI_Chr02g222580 [Amborella trichopoda]
MNNRNAQNPSLYFLSLNLSYQKPITPNPISEKTIHFHRKSQKSLILSLSISVKKPSILVVKNPKSHLCKKPSISVKKNPNSISKPAYLFF